MGEDDGGSSITVTSSSSSSSSDDRCAVERAGLDVGFQLSKEVSRCRNDWNDGAGSLREEKRLKVPRGHLHGVVNSREARFVCVSRGMPMNLIILFVS